MSRTVHFVRGLLLASLLLGPAVAGRADDEPKKNTDDAITANRKDLEALRTEHVLSPGSEKLGLPSGLDVSAFPAGSSAAVAPAPKPDSPDSLTAEVKSSGWLIDGMEKARDASGRDAGKNGYRGETDPRDRKELDNLRPNSKDPLNAMNEAAAKANDREQAESHGLKPGDKVPNPLTSYMATWMTAGDFALLQKPAMGPGGAFAKQLPDFTAQTAAGPGTNGTNGANGTNGTNDPAAGLVNLGPESSAGPTNPYLQALGGNPVPTSGTGTELGSHPLLGPLPLTPATSPVWLSPPVPEPSRTSQAVPDNLKPSDDAKYFPQLKRF